MPRPPRPVADGLLYHALNRGNNRAAVFFEAADHLAFLRSLRQTGTLGVSSVIGLTTQRGMCWSASEDLMRLASQTPRAG